jgi:hypothetical protein
MVVYNFKRIQPVPNATAFIDIVLTRTQRRTPTVIRAGFKISRIRAFYMRKVRFTEQTITERLGNIISEFPRLEVSTCIAVCVCLYICIYAYVYVCVRACVRVQLCMYTLRE